MTTASTIIEDEKTASTSCWGLTPAPVRAILFKVPYKERIDMNTDNANDTIISQMVQLLIAEKSEAFPKVLEIIMNHTMLAEREAHIGASRYVHTEQRNGYANGFKPRSFKSTAGMLHLKVPQVRGSEEGFYPKSLERGTRTERSLLLAAAEMYVQGVSTRRVETVFAAMGIEHFSAEQVSNAARELDAELSNWRNRSLGCVKVLYLDATYQKVRVDGVAVDLATFIATGIMENGHRAIIAVDSALDEAEIHWRNVLKNLVDRGIRGVELIVSDAHQGLAAARKAVFAGVKWQRCQMHLQQNAQSKISKTSLKSQVASDIRAIFNAPSMEEAKRLLNIAIEKYAKEQPKLSAWMEENIPDGFTVFSFPEPLRKKLRTNNLEERLNRSIKARTRLISVFPNQTSQIRLVSAICMEISDGWETGQLYLNVENI